MIKPTSRILYGMLILAIFYYFISFTKHEVVTDLTQVKLIPKPVLITATGESFAINEKTVPGFHWAGWRQ